MALSKRIIMSTTRPDLSDQIKGSRGDQILKTAQALATNTRWLLMHTPRFISYLANSQFVTLNRNLLSYTLRTLHDHSRRITEGEASEPADNDIAPPRKKRRDKTTYAANQAAGLSLDFALPEEGSTKKSIKQLIIESNQRINALKKADKPDMQTKIDKEQLKQIELTKIRIMHHASIRVDLYLLLLVAVYNTGIVINKGKTILQHGTGSREANTQGCHASLFPNLIFTTPKGENLSFLYQCLNYLSDTIFKKQVFDLTNTHFMNSLNLTNELPKIVNDFDGKIEGKYDFSNYVEEFIINLNACSRGDIDPIEGMKNFFNGMNRFFIHYENKYINSEHEQFKKNKYPASPAEVAIWKHQCRATFKKIAFLDWPEGTLFSRANKKLEIDPVYFNCMLGRKSLMGRLKPYRFYYHQIHQDVLTTPTVEMDRQIAKHKKNPEKYPLDKSKLPLNFPHPGSA